MSWRQPKKRYVGEQYVVMRVYKYIYIFILVLQSWNKVLMFRFSVIEIRARDKVGLENKSEIMSYFSMKNVSWCPSLEPLHWDGSNKRSQHTCIFLWRDIESNSWKNPVTPIFSGALKSVDTNTHNLDFTSYNSLLLNSTKITLGYFKIIYKAKDMILSAITWMYISYFCCFVQSHAKLGKNTILKETSRAIGKMKFMFYIFHSVLHKIQPNLKLQRIIHDTINGNDKSVAIRFISYSTRSKQEWGVHSNKTSWDFGLEVSLSI